MNLQRYLSVLLLLLITAALLRMHGNGDVIPAHKPLSQVPDVIEGWTGRDVTIDKETLDVLGSGDFLSRLYSQPGVLAQIGLFVAYFPTQRTGVTIHSPKHCLPGAGWSFESSKSVTLTDALGKQHHVGEYVITNGDLRQFVIYWYRSHGRSVASDYEAKFYLLIDAMRMNRTDGALIRVMTPIDPLSGVAAAKARAEAFTKDLMPMLPRFIPD